MLDAGGVAVRRGTDEGDDVEGPERRQLDECGEEERGDDGESRGGDAHQVARVQWTTDDRLADRCCDTQFELNS